jgi:hypothetical protein
MFLNLKSNSKQQTITEAEPQPLSPQNPQLPYHPNPYHPNTPNTPNTPNFERTPFANINPGSNGEQPRTTER